MSTDIDWQHELDSSFGTGNDVDAGALRRGGTHGPYADGARPRSSSPPPW